MASLYSFILSIGIFRYLSILGWYHCFSLKSYTRNYWSSLAMLGSEALITLKSMDLVIGNLLIIMYKFLISSIL